MKKLLLSLAILTFSFSAFAQFPAPYCAEVFNSGVEPITLVNFAGINNVNAPALSGALANNNFLSLIGNVVVGGTYTITLKGNTDGNFNNNYVVFVDWNSDNDFLDAGETYNIGSIFGSTGVDSKQLVGRIAVPTSTTIGNKRMRVSKKFSGSTTVFQAPCNPSGLLNFGQAQDYTISVTAASCLAPSSGVVVVNPLLSASISWTAGGSINNEYVLQVEGPGVPSDAINAGTNIVGTSFSTPTLLPENIYEFYVRAECTDGLEYSTWSGPFKFNTVSAPNCPVLINPVNGATGVVNGTTATPTPVAFSWTAVPGATSYDYFYGATSAATNFLSNYIGTTASITVPGSNTLFYWKIIAKNAGGSSINCSVFNFTTLNTALATDTFSSVNFKSFPNPVKDVLNLSYDKNITNVSVINLLGQEVLSTKLNNQEAKIDMSGLTTGAYMVRVTSDNEVKTIKVIKE